MTVRFTGGAVSASGTAAERPTFDVIVVAFGPEPLLERCVRSVLTSDGVIVRVLLVDNGCTNPVLERLSEDPDVELLRLPQNAGFSGGVMAASARLRADHVALLNSDATIEPEVLRGLAQVLSDPSIGIAMPLLLRVADGRINSAGNPLHLMGFSWAGQDGEEVGSARSGDVACVSGAALALRRTTWERLGGLPECYFLYHEDVDLSIASHQAGLRIVLDAALVAHHDHDWERNAQKLYLAERNRLVTVLTRYPGSVLLRLLPLIIATELGALLLGGLPGARIAKVRGHLWLLRNARWILHRRRMNLAAATDPAGFLARCSDRFDTSAPVSGAGLRLLDMVIPRYARLLRILPR